MVQGGEASARKANVLTQIPTNASANANINVLAIGRSLLSSCVSATFRLARIRHSRVRVYETLNVGLPLPFSRRPRKAQASVYSDFGSARLTNSSEVERECGIKGLPSHSERIRGSRAWADALGRTDCQGLNTQQAAALP